jgi:hypothetical protein
MCNCIILTVCEVLPISSFTHGKDPKDRSGHLICFFRPAISNERHQHPMSRIFTIVFYQPCTSFFLQSLRASAMATSDTESQSPNSVWPDKKPSHNNVISNIVVAGHGDQFIVSNSTEDQKVDDLSFVNSLVYTPEEEARVIRILDTRLFSWILVTTFVLNMDRTNHSNAISDNLPADLGFGINDVNTGLVIYAVFFATFTLSGAVIAKLAGPSRWIPILMFAWSLVTLSYALIQNRMCFSLCMACSKNVTGSGYWTVRAWIAITEGGAIPATLVYLSQ